MGIRGRTRPSGGVTMEPASDERPKVVIVGAGFGGLWAARTLARRDVDVTLIDRNNFHTFFPLLYQVAAAELVPTDIAHPVRSIFRKSPSVDFHMLEVTGVDLEGRRVQAGDVSFAYDSLILAPGSVPHYFGVAGAQEHSFPLRWMADAVPLRHHVLTRFEAATHEPDPAVRRRMLTFTVVGGGPTGVEYAGALAELIEGPLLRDYARVRRSEVRVLVMEANDRVLGGMPASLGKYAAERLARQGVTVRLGVRVERVTADSVELAGGEVVPSETVVWTAGIQGDPIVASWGFPVGPGGRVPVTRELHLEDHPEVYVVGDLCGVVDEDGDPFPQVAQAAIQQGRRAALNILARAEGKSGDPFRFRDPGMLAVIGRNAAVAHVFGRAFRGFVAWVLWLVIHLAWLVGFRNRTLVLVNWGLNYLFFDRAVRLILDAAGEPDSRRVASGIDRVKD